MTSPRSRPTITHLEPRATIAGSFNALSGVLSTHEIISVTDERGVLTFVNDNFCTISGYPREALLGKPHSIVKSNAHPPVFFEAMHESIQTTGSWHGTLENQRPDGTRYWLQASIFTLPNSDNPDWRYAMVSSDVSSRERQTRAFALLASPCADDALFRRIADAIYVGLGVRWIGIGRLRPEENAIYLEEFLDQGVPGELHHYSLEGSPCKLACTPGQRKIVEDRLAERFPGDPVLKEVGAVSYRGEGLFDERGTLLGVLFATDDKPCVEDPHERAVLAVAAQRASAALARQAHAQARAQSEKQLSIVLEAAQLGVWTYDFTDNSLSSDGRWLSRIGYAPVEFATQLSAWQSVTHPEDMRHIRGAYLVHRRRRVPFFECELRLLAKNGDWVWVLARGQIVSFGRAGRPLRMTGVYFDISSRKQEALRLAASEARNRAFLAAIPDLILISDRHERFTEYFAPKQFRSAFPPERVLGKYIHEVVQEPACSVIRASLRRVRDTRQTVIAEYAVETDAGMVWREGHYSPLGDGQVLHLIRDITARKASELVLERQRARFENVLKLSPVPIFVVADHGRERIWNSAFYRLLGLDETSIAPSDSAFFDLIHVDDRETVKRHWAEFLGGHTQYDIEYRLTQPDGSEERVVRAYATRTVLPDGDVLTIGMVVDLTAERHAMAEQARLHQQLRQSQKMHAVGQLTGGIAHDFNNILASILGYTKLTSMRPISATDPKLQGYLGAINTAGERGRTLIQKMLAFSRQEPGGDAAPTSVNAAIREVVNMLRAIIPAKINLWVNYATHEVSVLGDAMEMHQCLVNLVVNARDAISERGVIRISVERAAHRAGTCASCQLPFDGKYVVIEVADDGTGIEPSRLDKIFEPFYTSKAPGQGTGMGLAVVHGAMHRMGGHLEVLSSVEGSRIRMLFAPTPATAAVIEPLLATTLAQPPAPTGARVLVVEDEPALAHVLCEMLELSGYDVECHTSSMDAREALLNAPTDYSVLVSDQNMPQLSGLELAALAKRVNPRLPVIICTGFSEEVEGKSASALGLFALLAKPVDLDELIRCVSRAVARKAPAAKRAPKRRHR